MLLEEKKMNKMYLFLHDCDVHSSVNYLLLSLMIYLVGLFVFQIITKIIQKKKTRLEKSEQEDKENFPEIYESIQNGFPTQIPVYTGIL